MDYEPRTLGSKKCLSRNSQELSLAADLIGSALVFGCQSSFELNKPGDNPTHPFHVNSKSLWSVKYQMLQGMLIAERWLIEFLLGPPKNKRADDICVDCFSHNWRFPKGDTANELFQRQRTINKLVLHPTWTFVQAEPRHWTLTRIERCIQGLNTFADGIAKEWPDATNVLKKHVDSAAMILQLELP
jgi:hypothetical protein